MSKPRHVTIIFTLFLLLGFGSSALAQDQTPPQPQTPAPPQTPPPPAKPACGPDHQILYKRAVTLLDNAEKKLNANYTAEAKSLAKEAKSLFAILQKECGEEQRQRTLTPKEEEQEAINQKLAADEQTRAENLMKSAEEKFQKAQKLEITQPEMYTTLMRQVKAENEQAHKRSIKAMIYYMRTEQMLFSWLGR
jgi:hypothetical protein